MAKGVPKYLLRGSDLTVNEAFERNKQKNPKQLNVETEKKTHRTNT